MQSVAREVKGGLLGSHDATKETAAQVKEDERKVILDSVLARKPKKKRLSQLTAKEKQDALDTMLEEWINK